MAQFIGYLRGNRGQASRLGTKSSGISAKAQGWSIGGRVTVDHINGEDVVDISVTAGSNGSGFDLYLGRFHIDPTTGAIERVQS